MTLERYCASGTASAGGSEQSFEDIHNFEGAANFAALIVADRIEVVRELTALPSSENAT
jgi:hypothetical protein